MRTAQYFFIVLIAAISTGLILVSCDGGDGGAAAPQDITGRWTGTITQDELVVEMTADFTQNGENVNVIWTGYYRGATGEAITSDGIYRDGTFTGSVDGDVITLNFSGNTATGTSTGVSGPTSIVLTKA